MAFDGIAFLWGLVCLAQAKFGGSDLYVMTLHPTPAPDARTLSLTTSLTTSLPTVPRHRRRWALSLQQTAT